MYWVFKRETELTDGKSQQVIELMRMISAEIAEGGAG